MYNELSILERHYFVLYDSALTLKMSKMALNSFCDETLHIFSTFLQSVRVKDGVSLLQV